MKSLILLRHGKSDWKDEGLPDQERPLARRGLKSAKAMGLFLGKALQRPDSAVTSAAVRARSTLQEVFRGGGWQCPFRVTDALYEADPEHVLEEIRQEPDATETLLLVGHEPAWSHLASRLIGGGTVAVPTGCALRIDLDVSSWKDVDFGGGKLAWLLPPRLFTDGEIAL